MSRSFHDKLRKVFVYSAVSFRPFYPDVSMLWNFWMGPTPLGCPCPTKSKGWTMGWTHRLGIDILWHCKHRSTSTNQVYFILHNLELPERLVHVISLLHDSSGTISMEWLLSLRSKEHCPPTSDLMNSNKHPFCFVRGSRSRKREFPWNIYNLIERLAKIGWRQNI